MLKIIFRCDYAHIMRRFRKRRKKERYSLLIKEHYKFGVWKSEGKFYKSNGRYYARAVIVNYCVCFISITFGPRFGHYWAIMFARIANRNVLFNAQSMLDFARALWNPRNKGINNVIGYNKRKLIARIALARMADRPCQKSHICY